MVPMLAGVVEYRRQGFVTVRELYELFKRLALQGRILLNETIERGHVGLVVLAVVQLQGLLAHPAGSKSARGERKRGKGKCHENLHFCFM